MIFYYILFYWAVVQIFAPIPPPSPSLMWQKFSAMAMNKFKKENISEGFLWFVYKSHLQNKPIKNKKNLILGVDEISIGPYFSPVPISGVAKASCQGANK